MILSITIFSLFYLLLCIGMLLWLVWDWHNDYKCSMRRQKEFRRQIKERELEIERLKQSIARKQRLKTNGKL